MSTFTFSIDGHQLQVIEADGVDVDPKHPAKAVDYAVIATAQRYSFLLKTNKSTTASLSRYTIRSVMNTDFMPLLGQLGDSPNINQFVESTLLPQATAVLVYDPYAKSPKPVITKEPNPYTLTSRDKIPIRQNPTYLDDLKLIPKSGPTAPSTVDKEFTLNVDLTPYNGSIRTIFNGSPFIPPEDGKPLLATYFQAENFSSESNPLFVNYNDVVQVVVNNMIPIAHPIHLHGHVFWVVGRGKVDEGPYNPEKHSSKLQLMTIKRDVVLVPAASWTVIRFVADNPGVWTLHCHIDWHNAGGMSVSIIEGQELFLGNGTNTNVVGDGNINIDPEARRVCSLQGILI